MKIWGFHFCILLVLVSRVAVSAGEPAKFQKAIHFIREGKLTAAQTLMSELVQAYPLQALYWFNLGQLFLSMKQHTKAVSAFRTVISLKSSLAPAAQFYMSRAYRGLGKLRQANTELSRVRKERLPTNLEREVELDWLETRNPEIAPAIRSFRQQAYEEALVKLKGHEKLPAVKLIRGMSLARLKKYDQARIVLEEVRSEKSVAVLSREAERIRKKLPQRTPIAKRKLKVEGSLSSGFHTNVFGDGDSERKRRRWATLLTADLMFPLHQTSQVDIQTIYQLYWEEYPGLGSGRFLNQSIRTDFRYPLDGRTIILSPFLDWTIFADEGFIYRGGIRGVYQQTGASGWGSMVEVVKNTPAHSVYEYMSGYSFEWRPSWHKKQLLVNYVFRVNTIDDLPVGNDTLPLQQFAHGPSARYSYDYRQCKFTFSVSYLFEVYLRASLLGNKKRRDNQLVTKITVQRPLAKSLRLRIRAAYVDNNSNFGAGDPDDRSFGQFWVHAGVVWDIL